MAGPGTWPDRGHGRTGDMAGPGTWPDRGHGRTGDMTEDDGDMTPKVEVLCQ